MCSIRLEREGAWLLYAGFSEPDSPLPQLFNTFHRSHTRHYSLRPCEVTRCSCAVGRKASKSVRHRRRGLGHESRVSDDERRTRVNPIWHEIEDTGPTVRGSAAASLRDMRGGSYTSRSLPFGDEESAGYRNTPPLRRLR